MIKTSQNPTTKPNRQIFTVFYIYLGPITHLRADLKKNHSVWSVRHFEYKKPIFWDSWICIWNFFAQRGNQKKLSKNMDLLYSKWPHRTYEVNKKNSSTQDCNRAEKFTKNCQHQAVWFGWGILECFLQISPPDCNLECWSFFYSLRVFCAVILNTINPYFLTIFFLGPPLGQKNDPAQ